MLFTRDYMQDVFYNDRPRRDEVGRPVSGFGMAGELEPLTLALYPLADLGRVTRDAARFDRTGHDSRRLHSRRALCRTASAA